MRWIALHLLLAACDTPSPEFRGIPATRAVVAGSVFDIRINERRAEAIRLNTESRPRFAVVSAKAAFAMERLSGCKVTKTTGDVAMIQATLRCPKDPKWAARDHTHELPRSLECFEVQNYQSNATGEHRRDYDCDWVE